MGLNTMECYCIKIIKCINNIHYSNKKILTQTRKGVYALHQRTVWWVLFLHAIPSGRKALSPATSTIFHIITKRMLLQFGPRFLQSSGSSIFFPSKSCANKNYRFVFIRIIEFNVTLTRDCNILKEFRRQFSG
jgi:hypothetical protein